MARKKRKKPAKAITKTVSPQPAAEPALPVLPKLTDREEIFCHEYIKDLNAAQAARRAGYSMTDSMDASHIMRQVGVRERIDGLVEQRRQACLYDSRRIMEEIASIALADINTYLSIEEVEEPAYPNKVQKAGDPPPTLVYITRIHLRPWHTLDTRAVQAVKQSAEGVSFKMNDKLKALELLGRHMGVFKDGIGKNEAAALGAALMAGYNRMLEKNAAGKPSNA